MRCTFRKAVLFIVTCLLIALFTLTIGTGIMMWFFAGVVRFWAFPDCIEVRDDGSDGINFEKYDNGSDQYIPRNGIEGHLYLPTPVDACSYISPPPGGFPTNSTWIALVYNYPACPTEMVLNIRNAGYTLIIASSQNDSHLTVTREVSDTLFPIVVVEEYYADYLERRALSFSSDSSILVSVHANYRLIAFDGLGLGAFLSAFICVSLILCCVCRLCCKCGIERHLQKIKTLRRNFEKDTCVINMDELDIDDQPHRSRFLGRKFIPFVRYNSAAKNFRKTVLKGFADLKLRRVDQATVLQQLSKFPNAVAACSQHFRTSLLHHACLNGWNDIVKELVEKYSCDPNVKIYQPRRIYDMLAKVCASIDVIKYLVAEKIEWVQDSQWEVFRSLAVSDGAAIHCACKGGNLDIVKFLIEKSCDPVSRNIAGATPLHFACWEGHLDITKFLVEKGCDLASTAAGLTPLHLACAKGHLDIVKFLVVVKHCDHLQPATKKSSVTPLDLANSHSHIHVSSFLTSPEISRHAHYEYLSRLSFPPAFKVFVMGNPGVGKSTLVKAIQNRLTRNWFRSIIDKFKKVTGVELNTAGIIPVSINSDKLGKIIMYDLAGQYQYYSSHAALLEELVAYPGSLLMVVVDLSKSTEEITQTLHYWNSFIENHCRKTDSKLVKPDVVTVGSHADVVESRQSCAYACRCGNVSATKKKSADILNSLTSSVQVPDEIISLNCTQLSSAGLTELCDVIANYSTQFEKTVSTDNRLNFLHALFVQEFKEDVACKVSQIESHICQYQEEWNTDTLSKYLTILSETTQFLYLKNDCNVEASWVILDQGVLYSEVNGTVFAPDNFKEHHDISSSTGVVPFSNIEETFPKYNPEMIISFMIHLEFCHKIEELDVLLINRGHLGGNFNLQSPEKLYLFPALVSEDRPEESCTSIEQAHYKCGWSLQCIRPDQFLSPRFLHVLLLRLAFCFALVPEKVEDKACPVLQRQCNMWKNGIHWLNRDGVQAIVEIVEQNTAVTVVMGCLNRRELHAVACTRLRSEVIQTILKVKERFCGAVELRESLIHPAELASYPLENPKHIPSFTITELATAIAEDKKVVLTNKQRHKQNMLEISELLYFEPYTCFNSELIAEMFKDENSNKRVPSIDASIRNILSEPSPTYKALRSALDQYSVFCGRNPLLLAGQTTVTNASPTSVDSSVLRMKSHYRENTTDSLVPVSETNSIVPSPSKAATGLRLQSMPSAMPQQLSDIMDTTFTEAAGPTKVQVYDSPPPPSKATLSHDLSNTIPLRSDRPRLQQLLFLQGWGGRTVRVIEGVAASWENLALSLHFNENVIKIVARDNHYQSEGACREMFIRWLNGHRETRQPVNWDTLIDSLIEANFADVSDDLQLTLLPKDQITFNNPTPTVKSHDQEATPGDIHSIPHRTNKPHLRELHCLHSRRGKRVKVIEGVAAEWEELAKALHFESSVIEHVRHTSHQTEDACRDILQRWLEGEEGTRQPVTWATLIDSLIDAGFVDIATDLQEAVEDYPIDAVCL